MKMPPDAYTMVKTRDKSLVGDKSPYPTVEKIVIAEIKKELASHIQSQRTRASARTKIKRICDRPIFKDKGISNNGNNDINNKGKSGQK